MLCPLLQSPAVKAIVNPNDHSASRTGQRTHTHTRRHTHSDTHADTLSPVFAPGVLTKQETAGTRQKTAMPVRSTCSLILTPGGAWRHRHHTTSLSMAHTHTHKSIDTHTHTDAHIHTDTHRSALHIYILLLLSPTYLPPTSFSPSHPFPRAPSNSTPSISCYLSSFLTCSSPSSTPIHHPQLQNAWTNIHTHTYTHTHPHLSGTIREGESWRDVTACWRNRVPRNRDLAALTSAVLEHSELQPLTFVTDQACLESAGEPPTGRAAETRWEEEVM